MKPSAHKTIAQTPAPKRERIKGSAINPKGSAESKKSDIRYEDGGEVSSSVRKFYDWFINWYKDGKIYEKMNIFISIPNEFTKIDTKADSVILDLFEKIDQNIDAEKYMEEIISKADEFGVLIYLEPTPRNKSLIYSSIKPIKSANEIIQKFYLQDFENLSEDKLEEYKKYHLILLNQNKVDGGETGQEITCQNCDWHWNTNQSEKFDKYVCHKCGFDNKEYYMKQKSFKDGGEVSHISGKAGGVLVGRRHSEGGIKAVNKSNNQPLEMEGGEVVITRNAVSDGQKREFEGEMLTNKEILSRINQSGGGVSFADGGKVKNCGCSGKTYKYGGKMMSDFDIVEQINTYSELPKKLVSDTFDMTGVKYSNLQPSEAFRKIFKVGSYKSGGIMHEDGDYVYMVTKHIPSLKGFVKMKKSVKSPFEDDDALYSPIKHHYDIHFFRGGDEKSDKITKSEAYKTFLFDEYGIKFKDLPSKIQNALMLGNQKLIDNYINA